MSLIAWQVITPTGPEEPVVVPPALVERTLELLMLHCTSDEEAVRNVVADCLGKLTLLDAARLIPALQVQQHNAAHHLVPLFRERSGFVARED